MSLDLETVADGLGFPEGPAAMADGSLLFVDIKNETLSRVTTDRRVDVVAEIPGGPNGVAIVPTAWLMSATTAASIASFHSTE